jgi:hypothetical protein
MSLYAKYQIAPTRNIVEGSGSEHFSMKQLLFLVAAVPLLINFVFDLSFKYYPLLVVLSALPCFVGYHIVQSLLGTPLRPQKGLPNRPIEYYLDTKDLRVQGKMPIANFFEAYFDEKIDIKRDMLELLEDRHDWASFRLTLTQVSFFLSQFLPEMLWHSRKQDEDQVREHYDRGDDFYSWFCRSVNQWVR